MVDITKKPGRKPINKDQQVQIEQPKDAIEVVETDQTVQIESIENKPLRTLERRRERVPVSEQKRIMSIPNEDKNYFYRLVNDENEKIEKYLAGGYEIVDRNGENLSIDGRLQDPSWRQSSASQSVGLGIIGYLMRIPREWHEEDRAKKQRILDEKSIGLKQKAIAGIKSENVYGEISISD